MRILVMQVTRMGDMLQTTPLIRALRQKYPDARISVMIRPMAKGVAERNGDIDEIFLYDEEGMFVNMRSNDSDWLLEAYNYGDSIIRWIRESRFDVAYNCTHSVTSAMLLKIARIPKVVGAHMSDDWYFLVRGAWPNYMFNAVAQRDWNDLNLCDVMGRFAEEAPACHSLVYELDEEDRAFAGALLREHGVKPGDFVVCFQLGASDEKKRWEESRFANLGRLIETRYGAKIFLVGVEEEAPLGEVFERCAPGLGVPLYGKTTVSQLGALLQKSRFLVTNDTGTMHIAAAVGCPVVLVSVGFVHFRETGPYAAGQLAIEVRKSEVAGPTAPADPEEERAAIDPEHVLRAIEWHLTRRDGGQSESIEDDKDVAGVDIYYSEFAGDGCLEWYPAVQRPMRERDFLRMAYRAMWLHVLDARKHADSEAGCLARLLAHYDTERTESLHDWAERYDAEFDALSKLAERGMERARRLLETLKSKVPIRNASPMVKDLAALDEELRIFGEVHSGCRPLVSIARFERDNLESGDPRQLARATLQIYEVCRDRATSMRKKVAAVASAWDALKT